MEILDIEEVQTAPKTELAPIERMRAEIEAKNKPPSTFGPICTPPTFTDSTAFGVVAVGVPTATESTTFAEPSSPTEPAPVAADSDLVVPPAIAIVRAVAGYWGTDNKTAARWITERAAEIATLKG